MTTNQTPIPEPTSPTAVVVAKLPDFTTAPAWQDGGGDVYINLFCGLWDHWKDRDVDANELRSWAPWTPLDTADEWVKRIDRDKLAEVLKPYFNGGDVAYGEHVECADAVLAALPELMGDTTKEEA